MSISSERVTRKTTFRPDTNEVLCHFSCFLYFFSFSFFLGGRGERKWQPPSRYLSAVMNDALAAGLEWWRRSRATPRDVSWSAAPANTPAGKHLASGGITYQMEPGCVLVDSQKSCRLWWEERHISCQHRREAADCCRCRDARPPTGKREKSLSEREWKKGGEEEEERRRSDSRRGFSLGRKHV